MTFDNFPLIAIPDVSHQWRDGGYREFFKEMIQPISVATFV